ncbi:right-handed parallel beta-helix repeat-containing protein [Spirulina sp. CCNP1310]|nr:right-handed parallel beta-helix repeat-containing protein [Spirulina sp. CCNP1310]
MHYACSRIGTLALAIPMSLPILFTVPHAQAQTLSPQPALVQAEPTPSTLLPRFTGQFETGLGEAYGHTLWGIQGFIPFAQTPELNTFFAEARLLGFAEDQWGGNFRLGYREYLPTADLVWGGYVGYDLRRTRFKQSFHQLGFGGDLQGSRWVGRFNGYLPVGDRRRQVAQNQGAIIQNQGTNFRFTGERLLYDLLRQKTLTTTRQFQTAVAGWDLEAGYPLWAWETGRIYSYWGVYGLNIPRNGRYLGMRGRLLGEFNHRWTAGITVSTDGHFGTQLTVKLGAILGGQSTKADPSPTVLARLGRGVERQEAIALDHQQEVTTTVIRDRLNDQIARNPVTGEFWRFLHVTGGAVGGDGTFENPFGEVTAGVAIAQSAGNDVIYVNAGTNPGMAGFIIPDQVRVLSTGVVQSLDIADVGQVQLPGSGTGTLPRLDGATITTGGFTGRVAMGNNSQLSGFNVITTGVNQRGVIGVNVSNATIDRNNIRTEGNNQSHGISLHGNGGGTVSNTIITGNRITTTGSNGEGMYLHANGGTIRNTTITGNGVEAVNFNSDGIFLRADNGGTFSGAMVANNTVTTAGSAARGIFISTQNSTLNDVIVSGNTVTTTGPNDAIGDSTGVFLRSNANGILRDVTVVGNTVSTAGNLAQGIFVFSNGGGSLTNVGITNNLIQQAGQHSVFVQTNNAAGNVCIATFTGNRSDNPGVFAGGDDLNVAVFGGSTVNFVGFGNVGANNSGFGAIAGSPTGQPPSCP